MKDLIEVKYKIIDRGIEYPEDRIEVKVSKGGNVFEAVKHELNRNRKAMDLTAKFLVKIVEQNNIGWA
jgi:hypothetical protein